jgi:hypothetical protein
LDREFIPGQARLRPQAGDRVTVDGRERVWRAVELPDHLLHFDQLLEGLWWFAAAYAVAYIPSATNQTGVVLKAGSDDMAKVYLNGVEVYRSEYIRQWIPDKDEIKGLHVNAGTNVLVFKIINGRRIGKAPCAFPARS